MILFNNTIDEVLTLLDNEKELLKTNIDIAKKQKLIILNYMQNFANSTNLIDLTSTNTVMTYLDNLKQTINLCNENNSLLENHLNNIDKLVSNIKNNNSDPLLNIKNFNTEYIKARKTISENSLKIGNLLSEISEKSEFTFIKGISSITESGPSTEAIADSPVLSAVQKIAKKNEISTEPVSDSISPEPETPINTNATEISNNDQVTNIEPKKDYSENTLIISEISKTVVLPYNIKELEETLHIQPNKYSSIDDIIEQEYTLPISQFKNPFVSRFKEAFKLMKNRENTSTTEAFELGLELMFNYNLHPAIIAACKNLDELDIYLDYLENGEQSNFHCFKILFQFPPTVSKKSKKNDFA